MLTDNWVFILDKQSQNLNLDKVFEGNNSLPGDYYLEGIAAVFGKENNNGRIYDEDEYIPHLKYLKDKIKTKKLLGELDHPEKFDISLKNVSHVVENLYYDDKTRTLRIRVKLLDTPAGQIAKGLIDSGIPISISSRAAGTVGPDKKVSIKKIFTYDLVADPGFSDAQLERVYESNGFNLNRDNNITKNLQLLNEELGIKKSSGTKIYKIEDTEEFEKIINYNKKNHTMMTENKKEFVTVEDMNKYSILIKKELDRINSIMGSIKESKDPSNRGGSKGGTDRILERLEKMEKRFSQLEKYSDYLAENLDNSLKYSAYLSENLDDSISYSKYLAENIDKGISHSNYLAEQIDKSISYSEYVAENVDKNINYSKYLADKLEESINYSEYLSENLDNNISYSEYLAEGLEKGLYYSKALNEKLDNSISYSEMIAENLNKNIDYSEYLAENIGNNINYSEYLAENMDKNIRYSEYLAENLDKNIQYSEYIAESVNNSDYGKQSLNENNSKQPRQYAKRASNLNLNESSYAGDYKDLSEGINNLIKSVNTQQAELINSVNTRKTRTEILNESRQKSMEAGGLDFIERMPEEYREAWDNLSESHKNSIISQAAFRKLNTDYQIRDFWATRNLTSSQVGVQRLNENQETAERNITARGYSNEYIQNIANMLDKKFGKR